MTERPSIKLVMKWLLEDDDRLIMDNREQLRNIAAACAEIDEVVCRPCVDGYEVFMDGDNPCVTVRFSKLWQSRKRRRIRGEDCPPEKPRKCRLKPRKRRDR